MHNELLVPDGFQVVETSQIVKDGTVEFYTFKWIAMRRCQQLNDARTWPTYRYEIETVSKEVRQELGWLNRWSVTPYQNHLQKIE
jgi:hypothetical protein